MKLNCNKRKRWEHAHHPTPLARSCSCPRGSCHIISCHVMCYDVMSCHIMWCHVMLESYPDPNGRRTIRIFSKGWCTRHVCMWSHVHCWIMPWSCCPWLVTSTSQLSVPTARRWVQWNEVGWGCHCWDWFFSSASWVWSYSRCQCMLFVLFTWCWLDECVRELLNIFLIHLIVNGSYDCVLMMGYTLEHKMLLLIKLLDNLEY